MNSQQELLDAINAISQDKNKSCDTPATVLRVDGDTVWVHIDGGADETPVQKTINCSEGETVQVRISNGSAFLVGNASAPPTDDKAANMAHFVAEGAARVAQIADEKAEEAQPAYVSYKVYYKLSETRPDTPTDDTYVAEGWTENEPLWTSDDTRAMWYSIRTKEVSKAVVWSAPLELTSYANIQVLKNAILLEVGEGNVINSIQDSNGENILDSNDEPIYGSIGDLQATNAKIVETAQNILLQVSREYLSTSDAAQTYATQTSLELTDEEIRSDVSRTYVGKGNSGVQTLSSTMLQNVNGVNIYNNTLAVGDSYAHIDGNSFDIKTATTAGTIDDVNDDIVASFGQESFIKREYDTQYAHYTDHISFRGNSIRIGEIVNSSSEDGWEFKNNSIETYGNAGYPVKLDGAYGLQLGRKESLSTHTTVSNHHVLIRKYESDGFNTYSYSQIDESSIKCGTVDSFEAEYYHRTAIENGDIRTTGDVYDYDDGYKKTPTVLTSTSISAATTTYTFSNSAITTDSVIDIYDSIFGFSPTGMTVSTGSCTVTFPAQSSSHQIKLFVY